MPGAAIASAAPSWRQFGTSTERLCAGARWVPPSSKKKAAPRRLAHRFMSLSLKTIQQKRFTAEDAEVTQRTQRLDPCSPFQGESEGPIARRSGSEVGLAGSALESPTSPQPSPPAMGGEGVYWGRGERGGAGLGVDSRLLAAGDGLVAEDVARFVRAVDAVADIDLEELRLLGRTGGARLHPGEFEVGVADQILDDMVGGALGPGQQAPQPLGQRRLLRRFGGGAVDLAAEGGRRQGEGVADDARQPFVEFVLVGRLLERLVLRAGRRPDEARARRAVAGEDAVEPFLELPDLLGVPALRRGDKAGRDVALGEVLQLCELAAQPDMDGHHNRLDRREAVGLVRARVAWRVDQFVRCEQLPRAAVHHLLEGRGRRARAAAGVVDQQLQRGAVDDIEPDDVAGAVAADFQRRRVDDEQVFEQFAQPGREGPLAVGPLPEPREAVAARPRVGAGAAQAARLDRPVELFELV